MTPNEGSIGREPEGTSSIVPMQEDGLYTPASPMSTTPTDALPVEEMQILEEDGVDPNEDPVVAGVALVYPQFKQPVQQLAEKEKVPVENVLARVAMAILDLFTGRKAKITDVSREAKSKFSQIIASL